MYGKSAVPPAPRPPRAAQRNERSTETETETTCNRKQGLQLLSKRRKRWHRSAGVFAWLEGGVDGRRECEKRRE